MIISIAGKQSTASEPKASKTTKNGQQYKALLENGDESGEEDDDLDFLADQDDSDSGRSFV